jgi:hypothetical protein
MDDSKNYIYIITNGEDYKVGFSKNPNKRLKQLQTGNSKKLKLINVYQVPDRLVRIIEKEAHREIRIRYEKRGEWFKGASEFYVKLLVDMVCEKYYPQT